MEVLAWILAAAFAVLAGAVWLRGRRDPYREAVRRLATELREEGSLQEAREGDPPEVAELRKAVARGAAPAPQGRDPGAEALRGLFRFVEGAVLAPLEASLEASPSTDVRVESAVDALRDLAFYAERDRGDRDPAGGEGSAGGRTESASSENLSAVVQAVTREYTLESGVPVRFSGPPSALPVRIAAERFKDALYLLLANAGHFGGGSTVDVVTEADGGEVVLRIRDRGPGFSGEALDRAFDPFWSSEPDALGLGLTHARRVLEAQGAKLRIGNVEGGGAEVIVVLSRAT